MAILTVATLLIASFPAISNAAIYKANVNWSRENIGTGWASKSIKQTISAGDMDSNGFDDMIILDTVGNMWLYPGTSATTFGRKYQISSGWKNMRTVIGGVDFDGDSIPDLLAINRSGILTLFRGLGNGYIGTSAQIGTGWGSVNNISITQNGFNSHPIIMGSMGATLYAWETDGTGRFTNRITYGRGWDTMKLTAISNDVSGDAIPDMWAVANNGELRLYTANDFSGKSFKSYVVGSGWGSTLLFTPQPQNSRQVRAIFPDGILRQYTLNHFEPTSIPTTPPVVKPPTRVAPTGKNCPANYPIKGNASSKIYHMPGQRYYNVTTPEYCFRTEQDAKAAGFRKARV